LTFRGFSQKHPSWKSEPPPKGPLSDINLYAGEDLTAAEGAVAAASEAGTISARFVFNNPQPAPVSLRLKKATRRKSS
jgi:hypothetical protein